jgi:hypothetical protein
MKSCEGLVIPKWARLVFKRIRVVHLDRLAICNTFNMINKANSILNCLIDHDTRMVLPMYVKQFTILLLVSEVCIYNVSSSGESIVSAYGRIDLRLLSANS